MIVTSMLEECPIRKRVVVYNAERSGDVSPEKRRLMSVMMRVST